MRLSTLLACALIACAGSIGCDKDAKNFQAPAASGSSSDRTAVRLTLDWKPEPEFGGFYAAQLSGAFARNNLEVDLKTAGEGAPTTTLVASGQTDFATTAADQVILARSAGADVVAIFAVYQTSPQGIMTHKARGFTSIEGVFTHPGTLAAEDANWLKYLLHKFGPPKAQLIGYSGGIAVFLAKPDYSQQCFITSEPLLAKAQGSDPRTFLIADAGYNPYTTVVITSGKLLRERPQLATAMAQACRAGWRQYLDDPATANAKMAALNPQMDPETFAAAADAQKPLIETVETIKSGLGSMTAERWNVLSQQLLELKVIEKGAPAEECFRNPQEPATRP